MLESIAIQNYRNLKDLNIELSPSISLIVAPNGSGKTNFLESIFYSVFAESFRPINANQELVGDNTRQMRVKLKFDTFELDLLMNNNARKFLLNNKRVPLAKIPQKFPTILFAPQSVDLISREPGLRRQDLDLFLGIVNPRYKEVLAKYKVILKNRNSMIKMIRENKAKRADLEFWTNGLIENGAEIFRIRVKFFEEIREEIRHTVEFLSEGNEGLFELLDIEYVPSLIGSNIENYSELLSEKFRDNLEKEIIVGKTLYGVHKDDFQVLLDKKNLRFLGSRGQQRIGILLFKLAEAFYIQKLFGNLPLILLDDLMSELDVSNREKIATILLKIKTQLILTTADEREIPESLSSVATKISIV